MKKLCFLLLVHASINADMKESFDSVIKTVIPACKGAAKQTSQFFRFMIYPDIKDGLLRLQYDIVPQVKGQGGALARDAQERIVPLLCSMKECVIAGWHNVRSVHGQVLYRKNKIVISQTNYDSAMKFLCDPKTIIMGTGIVASAIFLYTKNKKEKVSRDDKTRDSN